MPTNKIRYLKFSNISRYVGNGAWTFIKVVDWIPNSPIAYNCQLSVVPAKSEQEQIAIMLEYKNQIGRKSERFVLPQDTAQLDLALVMQEAANIEWALTIDNIEIIIEPPDHEFGVVVFFYWWH